jgi:putative ABC transport system permease protein
VKSLDALAIAWRALVAHRRRSVLSLLGVSIGIAAVTLMTAIGQGARDFVAAQFQTIGANVIAIVPGRVETSGAIPGAGSAPNDLTLEDARALVRAVPGVIRGTPLVLGNEALEWRGRRRNVLVLGTTAEMLELRGMRVSTGTFLPDADWERGSAVIVLGAALPVELFPGEDPLGRNLRLGERRLRVIGTLAPRGTHLGVDLDQAVMIPVATAQAIFDTHSLFRILLETNSASALPSAQRAARELLASRHGEEDFTLLTQGAMLESLDRILNVLSMALVAIAAISLAVAGVGIANVMLVAVSERTREIGLCKALGATERDVLSQFLVEAMLLCVLGGLLGLGLGAVATRVLSWRFPEWHAHAPNWALVGAILLSFVVGLVSGAWPARRAMRMDPVTALAGRQG